jgi:hypothetical protein
VLRFKHLEDARMRDAACEPASKRKSDSNRGAR